MYRYGIVVLALLACALLVAVRAETFRLIPLFTIGVFVGFTVSQTGLVVHWFHTKPPRWRARAVLNGTGAVMTAVAVVVFLISKFVEGAWVVVLTIPLLMILFSRIERYYAGAARELKLGKTPPPPHKRESVVIVPTSIVSLLTEKALSAALSLGETVVAVAVAGDEQEREQIKDAWHDWQCGVPIEVLIDPQRSLTATVLRYIESVENEDATITVLIPLVVPRKRRHEILHNQRGPAARVGAQGADGRGRGDAAVPSARLTCETPYTRFEPLEVG